MRKTLAWVVAFLAVAIWAATFVSTKILLNEGLLPPEIFVLRFALAYICIWIFSPKLVWTNNARDEIYCLLLGVTGGSVYFLAENTALIYSTASNVAILVGSAPLLTALLVGMLYKEERLSKIQLGGSLIAFIGMALIVMNGQLVLHLNPIGDVLALSAAFLWALYSLIYKNISSKYNIVLMTRKIFAYGLLTMLLYFLAVRPIEIDTAILLRPVVWGNLLFLGLVASLLCFIMWNWALVELGTIRTTNIIYGQSFFTMCIASVVLSERITLMAIAGTAVLILGMVLALKKKNHL